MRSDAISVNYEPNPRVTVFTGFSYDSLFSSGLVSFLRGPA